MSHILQGDGFSADFILGQLFAGNVLVLHMVGAVDAAVDTVIGKIQGCKKDDALAVDLILDFPGQGVDPFQDGRIFAGKENGSFPVGESLQGAGFVEELPAVGQVAAVFVRKGQRVQDFLMVDEFICFG